MSTSRKSLPDVTTTKPQQSRRVAMKRSIIALGATRRHLQGADGRYSDNNSLRSYYK